MGGSGVPKKNLKKIVDHLTMIKILKESGMKGSSVIRAYHMRVVAPLMARTLPLHWMLLALSLEGMVLARGRLTHSEIAQCLKVAMDAPKDSSGSGIKFVFPMLRHPPMRLEPSHIRFVSRLLSSPLACSIFAHLTS